MTTYPPTFTLGHPRGELYVWLVLIAVAVVGLVGIAVAAWSV